jgi:hypothetical protein
MYLLMSQPEPDWKTRGQTLTYCAWSILAVRFALGTDGFLRFLCLLMFFAIGLFFPS